MPRVTYDLSGPSIVIDLLLESADGTSSLLIPVVLDTGASLTIVARDVLVRLGYDLANPLLERQRMVTGSGVEYAPRITVRSASAIGQKVTNLKSIFMPDPDFPDPDFPCLQISCLVPVLH